MKANNTIRAPFIYRIVTLCNIAITVLFFNLISYRYFPIGDPGIYASDIDGELIHDWWSALYTIIGISLKNILSIFYNNITGREIVALITSICIAILFVSTHYLVLHLLQGKYSRPILYAVASFAVFLFGTMPTSCNLDMPGLAFLASAVAVSLHIGHHRKRTDIALAFCVIVLLLIGISFRKPYIVLAPFILTFMMSRVVSMHTLKMYGMIFTFSSVLSLLLFIAPKMAYPLCNGYITSYPAEPMLRSDIYTAAILSNDLSTVKRLEKSLPCSKEIYHIGNNHSLGKIRNSNEWKVLREAWIEEWKKHPTFMLNARCLQIIQFLSGSVAPDCVIDFYCEHYPHLPKVGECKSNFVWYMYIHRQKYGLSTLFKYINLIILIMTVATIIIVGCSIREKGLINALHAPDVYLGILAVLSQLSYISVVVPTGDLRYKITTIFFSIIAIATYYRGQNNV